MVWVFLYSVVQPTYYSMGMGNGVYLYSPSYTFNNESAFKISSPTLTHIHTQMAAELPCKALTRPLGTM